MYKCESVYKCNRLIHKCTYTNVNPWQGGKQGRAGRAPNSPASRATAKGANREEGRECVQGAMSARSDGGATGTHDRPTDRIGSLSGRPAGWAPLAPCLPCLASLPARGAPSGAPLGLLLRWYSALRAGCYTSFCPAVVQVLHVHRQRIFCIRVGGVCIIGRLVLIHYVRCVLAVSPAHCIA